MHFNLRQDALHVSRVIRAHAIARPGDGDALTIATKFWGPAAAATEIIRKSGTSTNWASALAATPEAAQFIRAIGDIEVLSRLPNLRRVAPNTRHIAQVDGASASFVEEGHPIPVRANLLDAFNLRPKKVAAIIAATRETLESASIEAENSLQTDLLRACAEASDEALLDIGNTGSASTPASITHDALLIASNGDPASDFAQLVDEYEGDWSSAAFVCHPFTAAQLCLIGGSAFQNATMNGGDIFGRPLLTSRAVGRDSDGSSIYLIDGSGIAVSEAVPEFSTSENASIELDTVPDGTKAIVSMFQAECVAMKIVRRIIWRKVRDSAVIGVSGANYIATSS